MKSSRRPPRLEPSTGAPAPPPARSPEQRLAGARAAGRGAVGPSELRLLVERLDAAAPEAWAAVHAVFGAAPGRPEIDPATTVAAARRAGALLAARARAGARVAFATAAPASFLALHVALARAAAGAGAQLVTGDDAGPLRVDGRAPRWLRWVEGVAVVTDGRSLLAAEGPDAGREWVFRVGRPSLVLADGTFALAAVDDGLDTVAFGGLAHVALALPAARGARCTVVPVHPDRPPPAYGVVEELVVGAVTGGVAPPM
jgi:hypothetical protein